MSAERRVLGEGQRRVPVLTDAVQLQHRRSAAEALVQLGAPCDHDHAVDGAGGGQVRKRHVHLRQRLFQDPPKQIAV